MPRLHEDECGTWTEMCSIPLQNLMRIHHLLNVIVASSWTNEGHTNTESEKLSMLLFTSCIFNLWWTWPHCNGRIQKNCFLIAEKKEQPYSLTLFWLRCRLSFSLLRSAIVCLQGSRSSYHQPSTANPLESSIDYMCPS